MGVGVKIGQTARRVLVTGIGSGIGEAVAERFGKRGWDVVGIDLRTGPRTVVADVADEHSLAAAAARIASPLDALVCAAGIWDAADARYADVDTAVWKRTWEVNVTGTMLTLRTFVPHLGERGSITTIGSMAALAGMPGRDAYTASKGAVVALTRAWAADLGRRGTRVNCVCPGVTATPMTAAALQQEALSLPLGRPAMPEEIAEVIFATAQPEAAYLNGAVIPVDGGMTAAAQTVRLAPMRPCTTKGET